MIRVNVHEAKANLSKYLNDLAAGREDVVVVCNRNVAVAELRPVATRRTSPRPFGLARGTFTLADSFFEPLPDEVVRGFEGDAP